MVEGQGSGQGSLLCLGYKFSELTNLPNTTLTSSHDKLRVVSISEA